MGNKITPSWAQARPVLKFSAAAILAVGSVGVMPSPVPLNAQAGATSSSLCGQVMSDRSRLECYDLVAACSAMTDGRERLTCYDRMNNPNVPQSELYSGSDLAASNPDQNTLPPAVQQAPYLRSSLPSNLSAGPANSRQTDQRQQSSTSSVDTYGQGQNIFGGVLESGQLRAVITAVRQDVRSRQLYFEFENGQVWKQVDEKRVDPVPDKGDRATITPSSFGSYLLTVDGRRFSVKVRRLS